MGRYFVAFALIGLQCMLTPPLLLLMPWLVVCALPMESLHGRTLLASLWGLLFPFWIACGVLFLAGHTAPIVAYLGSVVPAAYPVLPPLAATSQWLLLLWALLLIVPGSVTVLVSRTMKLQASAGFRLMLLALVVLLTASAGNTLGGITCYSLGLIASPEWLQRTFRIKDKYMQRARALVQRWGIWMGLLCWLPLLGSALLLTLGIMRSRPLLTNLMMILGRTLRYAFVLLSALGVIRWIG